MIDYICYSSTKIFPGVIGYVDGGVFNVSSEEKALTDILVFHLR